MPEVRRARKISPPPHSAVSIASGAIDDAMRPRQFSGRASCDLGSDDEPPSNDNLHKGQDRIFGMVLSDCSTNPLPAVSLTQSVMFLLKPFQKIATEIVTPSAFMAA